jgi:antitoxin ParD1/3/4
MGVPMATVNVSLSEEFVAFVEAQVSSGDYATASEVVRDALRLLRREAAAHEEKLAILGREVGIGVAQAHAGNFSKRSIADIAAELAAADGEPE